MENQSQIESTDSKLTSVQKQRYDSIHPIYGSDTMLIVKTVQGKGKYSWQTFVDKMEIMQRVSIREKEYINSLYDTFNLFETYTPTEIVALVAEVRRELELPPYYQKIKVLSEQDFFKIFVVVEDFEEPLDDGVKVFKGYKPVVRIKPE